MRDPVFVSGPFPQYTAAALCREIQGRAEVRCVVTEAGLVVDCCVVRSIPFMDGAFIDALQKRRYTPATLDGQPIRVEYTFLPHPTATGISTLDGPAFLVGRCPSAAASS